LGYESNNFVAAIRYHKAFLCVLKRIQYPICCAIQFVGQAGRAGRRRHESESEWQGGRDPEYRKILSEIWEAYIYLNTRIPATYDHRLQRTRDPVRSPIYKL
jgi:hypothetical protein